MPSISIKQGYKTYYLNWEIIHQDKRCMRIKVTPVANPGKYVILENNEPLIRGKYKLKNRRIDWKLIEGEMRKSAMEMIIEAIVNPQKAEKKLPMPSLKATNTRDRQFKLNSVLCSSPSGTTAGYLRVLSFVPILFHCQGKKQSYTLSCPFVVQIDNLCLNPKEKCAGSVLYETMK